MRIRSIEEMRNREVTARVRVLEYYGGTSESFELRSIIRKTGGLMISQARASLALFAMVLAMAGLVRTAASADLGPSPAPASPLSKWTLMVAPYGWATWLDGTETVKGRTVDVSVSPTELIGDLDQVPFMGYVEARRGPFALYGDLVYASVGLDADAVRSRRVRPEVGGTVAASAGLDYEQTILELGGAYQVVGGTTAFDVLAGARYWHQHANLRLRISADVEIGDLDISRGIAIARSGGVDWVDPVIGARIRHQLAPGKELMLRGDIGGFGAGSQFSWNVMAGYSFVLCDKDGVTYSGLLGYRLLDVDYEQGSGRTKYEYDVLQHGPLLGLAVSF